MPGGDIFTESLEERIERIRKRDEEIEKKHREAEADRLAALQANAMVKTTAPDDDEWPKAHKYDKLDFTYDVKEDNADDAEKKVEEPRLLRPLKKFPEGQGPPADPTYNFLAEPERDGKVPITDKSIDAKKDWRANNNNNNNGTGGGGLTRRSNNNNSFNRGKNGAKGKSTNLKGKQQGSTEEMTPRKTDTDRNSEEKMKRNKSIEGNWRQESIDDKKNDSKEAKAEDRQRKFKTDGNAGSFESKSTGNKPSIQQRLGSKPKADINNLPEKLSDLSIEKRGNITVSVTKDGEVKSVKLEANRVIGTGRVGNGSTMRPNAQQQNKSVQQQAYQQQQQQQLQHQQQQQQKQQQQQQQKQQQQEQQQQQQQLQQQQQQQQLQQQQQQLQQQQQQQLQQQQQQQQLQQQQQQQQFVAQKIDSNLNALAPSYAIDYTQFQPQPMIIPQPKPSNIVNGVPFKLPSIQERLTKNRVYFDGNLKNSDELANN